MAQFVGDGQGDFPVILQVTDLVELDGKGVGVHFVSVAGGLGELAAEQGLHAVGKRLMVGQRDVGAILLFHVLVNVGMTIGLMPVMGIPLPFMSYGGSSLIAFTILLFIAVRLDASTRQFSLTKF